MNSFFDKTVRGLIDDISELSLALASTSRPPKYPALFLASSFVATALASNYLLSALLLLPTVAYALRYRTLRKVIGYTALFSLIISAPLFFTSKLVNALDFVIRVVASSAAFSSLVVLVGWKGFVDALSDIGMPNEIVFSLRLLPYQLHFMLKDALSATLARRSRTFSNDLKSTWRVLATVVGSLLLRGVRRGQTLSLAIKARGLLTPNTKRYYLPTIISIIMMGVSLVGFVLEGRVVPLR